MENTKTISTEVTNASEATASNGMNNINNVERCSTIQFVLAAALRITRELVPPTICE